MIRAIPVVYKGTRFRSTLEANWAEYFDHLGLPWMYEPAALAVGRYEAWLPDFFLPTLKLFVECKAWFGKRLPKVGRFVQETRQDVLVCFPEGRFVLCSHYDWLAAECGYHEEGQIPHFLISKNWDGIEAAMKNRSCLQTDESDRDVSFVNYGEFCPDYCGYEPEYWNSMKDRSGPDGRDARSYYWGEFSTWHQRSFQPSKHVRA